ncbi:hypothetical protein KJ596_04840, partial [Patescibacteria group bacterium]|nr:hypothetical protein [Patescibacteria group bacterium]MBU1868476.1 hypothetical protein [Patescibacteria group bacterium]
YYGWQYGPREIISYFQKNNADYEELIMDYHFNSPGIFFKFYAPENYDQCRVGSIQELFDPKKKQLFAYRPEIIEENWLFFQDKNVRTIKLIPYPNGEPAFHLFEITPNTQL